MSFTDDFTTKHRHRDERFSKQRKLLSNAMVMDISDASEFNYSDGAAMKSLPERFATSQHNYQNQKVSKFTKLHSVSPVNYQKHRPMVCDSRFRRILTKPKSTRSETLFDTQQKYEKLPTNSCNSVSKCNSIAISTTTLNPEQPVNDICNRIETILSSTLCQTDSSVFNIAHGACQTELNNDSKPITVSNSKTALESTTDVVNNPWIFTQSKDCLFKLPIKSKKSLSLNNNEQKKSLKNFKFDNFTIKPSVKSSLPVAVDASESLTHTFLRMQKRSISGVLMNWLQSILDIFLKPPPPSNENSEMELRNHNRRVNTLTQISNVIIFVTAMFVSVSVFGGFCTILLPVDFSTIFTTAKPEPKQTIEIDSVANGVRKLVTFLANMLRLVYGRERDCSIHFFSQRDKCK